MAVTQGWKDTGLYIQYAREAYATGDAYKYRVMFRDVRHGHTVIAYMSIFRFLPGMYRYESSSIE